MLVLAVLMWRIGPAPVVEGLRSVDASALVAAVLLGMVATVCCTWRWRLVARGLHVDVPVGSGIASYYRSQFLNTVLPGGVLGDVHRALSHGRETGDTVGAVRAVAWERSAGQAVQALLTVLVLSVVPSPVSSAMPAVVALAAAGAVVGVLAYLVLPSSGMSWWARTGRTLRADVREVLLAARIWPGVVLASSVVVACHVTAFVVAARTAGSAAPLARVVPLALVVLLAMSVPLSIGGWGPREGVAAWAFASAGSGAALGVSTAVVYGVMVTVATLPGLAVLGARALRRPVRRDVVSGAAATPLPVTAAAGGTRV